MNISAYWCFQESYLGIDVLFNCSYQYQIADIMSYVCTDLLQLRGHMVSLHETSDNPDYILQFEELVALTRDRDSELRAESGKDNIKNGAVVGFVRTPTAKIPDLEIFRRLHTAVRDLSSFYKPSFPVLRVSGEVAANVFACQNTYVLQAQLDDTWLFGRPANCRKYWLPLSLLGLDRYNNCELNLMDQNPKSWDCLLSRSMAPS